MQQINVNELKPHPRNNEFFDDMTGDKWNEFLESVRTSGVIEPIVITPDYIIVSGHQRVRACKELGITSVLCDIHAYKDEDQILKDLLETNIRQRGDVGGSAKKVGLRIKELERLYGIMHGSSSFQGNQYEVTPNNSDTPTQEQLASQFNISVDTLLNYKLLADMIPELEELLDTGIVTKTTALAIMRNLSDKEQEELISSLDTTQKITQREVKKYIEKIKELESHQPETKIVEKEKVIDNTNYSLENRNKELQQQITKLQKDKSDMELINRTLRSSKEATEKLMSVYEMEFEEYSKMKNDIATLGLQPDGDYNILELSCSITTLTNEIEELLTTKLSPMRYSKILPVIKSNNALKRNMENLIYIVDDWCKSMADTIGITTNKNIIDMEDVN